VGKGTEPVAKRPGPVMDGDGGLPMGSEIVYGNDRIGQYGGDYTRWRKLRV
jgi:hypothetical protein